MKPKVKIYPNARATALLISLMLFVFAACEDSLEIPERQSDILLSDSFIAGTDGGYFKALNGNVELFLPKNALVEEVGIFIGEGSEDEEGDFVIHSIIIEPKDLEFLRPVSVRLRYDGCLKNSKDPCKAECLALYYFENDKDFDVRRPQDLIWMELCCLNTMDQCIETQIHGGGVYAIGEASMDQTKH